MELKLKRAIEKVYRVNRILRGLENSIEEAKAIIRHRGGGETKTLIATVEKVAAHTSFVRKHSRVVVRRK